MKNLSEYINENIISPWENYDTSLIYDGEYKECVIYKDNCSNLLLFEGSFNRLLSKLNNKEFAIITAYRAKFDKKENIKRNRNLRGILNQNKMGPMQLVGHWRENQNSDIPYDKSKEKDLIDAVERSYLVVKPQDMEDTEFVDILKKCMKIDGEEQDCIILCRNHNIYCMNNSKMDYSLDKIGDGVTMNKIGQAYSQYVRKTDKPFVFEGILEPGSNFGKQSYTQTYGFSCFPHLVGNNIISENAIDDQWIADEKPVKTADGRQAIITKVDMKVIPNIIYGQVKMKNKLFDYQWEDTGKCVKAVDNLGNPKKPDDADALVKVI